MVGHKLGEFAPTRTPSEDMQVIRKSNDYKEKLSYNGNKKKISADKRKEALKLAYFAKLQNVPTSRKMRLVVDMIRE